MTRTRPRICFVQAGGTLISMGADRLDFTSYGDTRVRLDAEQVVARSPELGQLAEMSSREFRPGGSRTWVMQDWLLLLAAVREVLADEDCDGVVIGHGTNSLEETSYFLDLTLADPRPVVVVGAMRPPNTMGSDAELNLLNAVRVASDLQARGRGVLVSMDGTVHAARDVVKTSTYGLDSFRSRDWGPLGIVAADGAVRWSPTAAATGRVRADFSPDPDGALDRVDIVLSHVGADGTFIDAARAAGARGIVSAGTGAGVVTLAEEAALVRAAAAGVVVCHSTRVSAGAVLRTAAMRRLGFLAAGTLPPWKARILLSLSLGRTGDAEAIQEFFDRS